MVHRNIEDYHFETGIYRPPSEGGSNSLLVRFTRNCPWNRCRFCAMYKGKKFQVRPLSEIKQDIDAMAAICEDLQIISAELGYPEVIAREAVVSLLTQVPGLNHHPGFPMLYGWMLEGGRTAFLQDANSLIMKTDQLVGALRHLKGTFPSIQRITTYARSKTLVQKSQDDLCSIHQAGLDRLHVGLESGDDGLLKKISKGATSQVHIDGGRKAMQAGFQLSEYWMPGLGGKALWKAHALNTANVLNAINPHYIRSRPFHPAPGTPLFDDVQDGAYKLLSPKEQLSELKMMIMALDVTSKVCFDHAGNYWKDQEGNLLFSHSYEGYKFPERKDEVLSRIDKGLKANNRRPGILNL